MKSKINYSFTFLLAFIIITTFFCQHSVYCQSKHDLKKWTEEYAKALSSPDWAKKMGKFGWEGDMSGHQEFRDAYANYKAEIKNIVVEGNEVMAWLEISAKWVGNYQFDDLKEAKPTGKPISWDEIWYFNVVDGKLGGNWQLMADGVGRMKSAGVKCLPE